MKKLFVTCLIFLFSVQNGFSQQSDLRKKIGQMIMVGYSGKFIPKSLIDDLQTRNLGGVVYFASNIVNPYQLKNISDSIKLLSTITPFIAIDQEGGKVARLSASNGYEPTYSAYKLGTIINKEDTTRWMARKMADWLKNGGVNIDLAPVADVNVNPLSPAIGKVERSFSKNPDTVFYHAGWFINEMNSKNIITALKHFPGHGSAMQDSHLGFTDISNTWSEMELIPYQKLIGQGYKDFIMSAHVFNNKIDTGYPASLSKNTLTDLLRNKLSFTGLIITDELFMQAITKNYSFERSIELAVNAGNDVLLFSTNIRNNSSLVEEVINIIEKKINDKDILLSRVEESYNRIMDIKRRYSLQSSFAEHTGNSFPEKIALSNYPNPFNPSTTISFTIPQRMDGRSSSVTMKVFDILGREAANLVDKKMFPGSYQVEFPSGGVNDNLSSGVYFCCLKVDSKIEVLKMFLIR